MAAVKTLIASNPLDDELSTRFGAVTPLRYAIASRKEEIALLLVAAGASFDATDLTLNDVADKGLTNLIAALVNSGHVKLEPTHSGLWSAALNGYYGIVSTLLQAAEERQIPWDDIDRRALNVALGARRSDIALMMIERGVSMDHRTAYAAGRVIFTGIMQEILQRGIDPNEPIPGRGLDGARTALGVTWRRYGFTEEGSTDRTKAELSLYHLIAAGAEFGTDPRPDNHVLNDIETRAGALYARFEGLPDGDLEKLKFAAQYGYIQMIRKGRPFLDNLTEEDLEALLVSSLIHYNDDIARYLIDYGAQVTRRVLHAAVKESSPGIVRLAFRQSDSKMLADESAPLLATWAAQIPSQGADLHVLAELIGGTDVCQLIHAVDSETVDSGPVDHTRIANMPELPLEMIEQAAWGCERFEEIGGGRIE